MKLFTTSARARNILLCCLFVIGFLAVPVQSQVVTNTPTATPEPTPLADPSGADLAACGLPASFATFSSAATLTMTADCTAADSYGTNPSFLTFSSGTSTITGGDNRITGATNGGIIRVTGSSTTLTLNNIIFDNTGDSASTGEYIIEVTGGATLNVNNVIFRNNVNRGVRVLTDGVINFMNVQFLNNTQPQAHSGFIQNFVSDATDVVTIQNALFQGNRGATDVIVNDQGVLNLSGCLIFADNVQADGTTPSGNISGNIASDTSTTSCPASFITPTPTPTVTPTPRPRKKKAEAATPVPTATARPQIAATHVALQASTGATFRTAFGLDSGVHFRQLDGAGIGVQSIIDAGYLEAFDVYGYVEQGVEVCFPQIGRVVFLDARTMPRAIVALESTVVNGQTCVSINSPGSLVLLPN